MRICSRERSEPRQHEDPRDGQRGGVLILALFLMVFALGVIVTGAMTLKSSDSNTSLAFLHSGQAEAFARSGLTEAINWFRRQPVQPVLAFAPKRDESVDPPLLDTLDADIGLVREFQITGDVYGRYEVWKAWDADPDVTRLQWRKKVQAEDVSMPRGKGTDGVSWRLRGVGYVFMKRDKTRSMRERPNYVIATETLECEISRLAFALPGQAALNARNGGGVDLKAKSRVAGGVSGVGVYYATGSGTPTVDPDAELTGVQPSAPAAFYDDSTKYVFGVTDEQLDAMADLYLTDGNDFPAVVAEGSLIVVQDSKKLEFDAKNPLKGSGIIVVRGDVEIKPNSGSQFFGLLYIDGDLKLASPSLIQGAVILTGTLQAIGSGDYTEIIYDDAVIQSIQGARASYSISRAPRRRFLESRARGR